MLLYGSIKQREFSDKAWYFHIPDLWVKNLYYVKKHPYLFLSDKEFPDYDKEIDSFDFYKLDLNFIDFNKVFDLRFDFWREKINAFVTAFAPGWKHTKPLNKLMSPVECLMSFGNYNLLIKNGYQWSVMKHGPDIEGNYVELWYYLGTKDPRSLYTIEKV